MEKQNSFSEKRHAIFDVLMTQGHPSAESIYHLLKPRFPRLSLGTVYRNLQRFKQEGRLRSLAVVDGQERFDGDTSEHTHFICDVCKTIFDVNIPLPDHIGQSIYKDGFHITIRQLFLRGSCPKCVSKEKNIS